jgi:molybdopterin molybdotransferase
MIQFKEALSIVYSHAPFQKVRRVALESVCRRVLAQDIYATGDAPGFDKSVADGFAVCFHDLKHGTGVLRIAGFIPAGSNPPQRLKKGTCAKIATGAMVPAGADAVVMKEDVEVEGEGLVRISKAVRRGENIYRRASDFKKGTLLLKKGHSLNMAAVALLASQGKASVPVFGAPSVAILSTGDEIIEPGEKKRSGQTWNSSAPMLLHALRLMPIEVRYLGLVRDKESDLLKKIKSGLRSDILIITGAVSVGERDLVPQVLRKAGIKILFHKVRIRPGKPLLFGVKADRLIFGLPGNPVSTFVGFLLFIRPLLQRLLGKKIDFHLEEGILAKGVYNKSGRLSFFPALIGRKNSVQPLPYSGSADLLAAARADAFFILAPKEIKKPRNSRVKFLRIPRC